MEDIIDAKFAKNVFSRERNTVKLIRTSQTTVIQGVLLQEALNDFVKYMTLKGRCPLRRSIGYAVVLRFYTLLFYALQHMRSIDAILKANYIITMSQFIVV